LRSAPPRLNTECVRKVPPPPPRHIHLHFS
jgi:hypothetical protein